VPMRERGYRPGRFRNRLRAVCVPYELESKR
jgi:hypothetical protein